MGGGGAVIQSAEKQKVDSSEANGNQFGGNSQQVVANRAGNSKRKGEGDGNQEEGQPKVQKMAYNEAVKKHLMVEIRCSDPSRELDQADFNNLEDALTEVLTQDDQFNFKFNPETDIIQCGLCQGVI